MFDRSFERSSTYFTVLQLLRIFNEAIQETADPMKEIVSQWHNEQTFTKSVHGDDWNHRFSVDTQTILRKNWEIVLSHHQKALQVLVDRIDKKNEELKSLRDGVRPFLSHSRYPLT
jgi:hypothetical protein